MEPLDLRLAPPRGPREKLLGIAFLPRTIDKIRAELPGGDPGAYFVEFPGGMSAYVLRKLGIDLAALRTVVASATNESAVADWLRENADLAAGESLNRQIENVTVGQMPPERRASFDALYPQAAEMPDDTKIFDVIERDDARVFS